MKYLKDALKAVEGMDHVPDSIFHAVSPMIQCFRAFIFAGLARIIKTTEIKAVDAAFTLRLYLKSTLSPEFIDAKHALAYRRIRIIPSGFDVIFSNSSFHPDIISLPFTSGMKIIRLSG